MAQSVSASVSLDTSAGSTPGVTPTINKKGASRRYRAWCFTLNNYTDADQQFIRDWPCRYAVWGREVAPSTGTPHLQGYIAFRNLQAFTKMKLAIPRAHWEPARGNSLQNRDYCTKGGDWEEFGDRPMTAAEKGLAGNAAYEDAFEKARQGDVDEIDAQMRISHYRTWEHIATKYMNPPEDNDGCRAIWLWGPPGTGKSRLARELFPGIYDKPANKWWDGYQDGPALIDDFDKAHACLGHHLKRWADRYSFTAEIKGGTRSIRPSWLVITSNYDIQGIWPFEGDAVLRTALERRFHVIHLPSEGYDYTRDMLLIHTARQRLADQNDQ